MGRFLRSDKPIAAPNAVFMAKIRRKDIL